MSTLGEKLEGLVTKWRGFGERSIMEEAYTALGEARGYRNCATELEAVLLAEGGSNDNAKEELDAIDELCGPRQPDDATSVFCRISHKLRAAAPSLHKEGPDAQLMYETYEQYRERLHKEGAGGAPAAGNSESIYRCETDHTFNAVAHSRFDGPPLHCPECGSKKLEDITVTLAPLPLQRTLPDEQFKGVVVEAIGGAQGELVKRITDYLSSGGLFNPEMALHDRVRQLLIDCRELLAASPAGRAEQEQ